ncbi:MAG: type III pantothenate kinase [Ruminococcaceae bacterium]|nr:type III pantothenate kinase [Oscillospiraceae bacterium]
MILTATVGNRTISFALFKESDDPKAAKPLATARIAAQPPRTADEYAALLAAILAQSVPQAAIKIVIVASVVPSLTQDVINAVGQLYPQAVCLTVGAGLRSGFVIRTDLPAELGADLVALTVGALALREPPFLVYNCGAVTTLSAVGKGKGTPEFLGCAILPGPLLCADALKLHAAQLPNVALTRPNAAIGKNTGDSMRSGLLLGHAAALEGLAKAFEREMGETVSAVIVTGESAEIALPLLERTVEHDEWLAHRGLLRLAQLNGQKSGKAPKRA